MILDDTMKKLQILEETKDVKDYKHQRVQIPNIAPCHKWKLYDLLIYLNLKLCITSASLLQKMKNKNKILHIA